MILYKVFYRNCEFKRGDLIGMLMERRKDLRGMKQVESGLRWAKLTFGRIVKDKKEIFIVPYELNSESETKWLVEKGVFTKEELLDLVRAVDRETREKSKTVKTPT